jgi:demethylmenaquinone methyltransferase/2-methoxy-6-polyprenyl-1,4-benzoquinol methylase
VNLPDRARALESYRRLAPGYDQATRRIGRKRLRAIDLLRLAPGDVVLDAACGTGAALDVLSRAVGSGGRVIGVELSSPMIAQARERVERSGLRNVVLIEAPMEAAALPGPVDAVLFSYAHDVLRSPAALRNIFAAARPGARVAAVGAKLYPAALSFLNFWVRWRIRHYVSTLDGLEAPWRLLAEHVPDFRIAEVSLLGSGYVGSGTYRRGVGRAA